MAKIWQANYAHEDFEIISESVAYDGHFRVLDQKLRFRMFSGAWSPIIRREKITRQAAVVVLLYHPGEDAVLFVEQFRTGAIGHNDNDIDSPWLLEPVAGLIELNDTIEETAKREVEEEAGCEVLDLFPVCKYLASPGMTNEMVYILCGRINNYKLDDTHGLLSESEDIKTHIFPVNDAFKLLEDNKMLAASGIIALQWLKININMVRDRWKKKN